MSFTNIEFLHAAMRKAHEERLDAFNDGNPEGCSELYETDGVLRALPFSTFRGREEITSFWDRIISSGFGDVECLEPNLEILDEKSVIFSAKWRANRVYGNVTKALWILQSDGSILLREEVIEFHGERIDFTKGGESSLDSNLMLSEHALPFSQEEKQQ